MVAIAVGGIICLVSGFRAAWVVFATGLPVGMALRLAGRGRVERASLVLVASMLAVATWLLADGYGLQDVALLLYPVIVLISGLLMARRSFVLTVALALASLCFVAWGQARGHITMLNPDVWSNLLLASLMLGVASAVVHLLAEDLRRSLRAARRSEERYRLISEVSSDYTFSSVVDEAGRVRQDWVAGAFSAMTGYTFAEYMERGGWRAALHPDDAAQDDRDLVALCANRPVVSDVRTFTRTGEIRSVRVYARPVWNDAEGRLVGIYGAVQDITERKRAEAEREALIRELAAKNAELERFTYTASHDLKSPLVTVRGFLGFVEKDAREGNHERLRADLQRIREATEKMGRLLDELLELSRVGRVVGTPQAISFAELAQEAVGLVAGRIAERGVQVEIAPELGMVWGDRTRLRQVVQNLIDNAVKFGDAQAPRVEIGMRRDEGERVFVVRDNGVGIEPRHRERVFGLFDKLDPASAGTGVGLALVKRIVELHGGRVWVESEGPGTGAAFCFTLPEPPASGSGPS